MAESRSFFSYPAVQAAVPAAYAWAVTVAPAAIGKGGTLLAQLFALLALTAVAGGVVLERTERARFSQPIVVWGMTLASAGTWLASPARALSFDTLHGVAGIVGWFLFALATAAPALKSERDGASSPLRGLPASKVPVVRPFGPLLGLAASFCIALLGYGWHEATIERAVFLRVASVVLCLIILGVGTRVLGLPKTGREAKSPSAWSQVVRIALALAMTTLVVIYMYVWA